MATIMPTPQPAPATGAWAWLNDLATYDQQKNSKLPSTKPVVPPVTKPKPKAYMSEADKQRIDMGLSLFGFGAFYSDRGRRDAAGATTNVATRPAVIGGKTIVQKPGGLTANQGVLAIGQPIVIR